MIALALSSGLVALRAETGEAAWLRYERIDPPNARELYRSLPPSVVILDKSAIAETAQSELLRGLHGMLGLTLRIGDKPGADSCILIGTIAEVRQAAPGVLLPENLMADGYVLRTADLFGHRALLIAAANDRGLLYGAYVLLRKIALRQQLYFLDEVAAPQNPIRWTNEWNNLNGTIERGYAGKSIFFDSGKVRSDLARASEYARLLASIGINGCTVNNVNADVRVLSSDFIQELKRLAAVFRPYGVQISIAVDFSSPKTAGGLDTFDPLDERVATWWRNKADELYQAIPDLGGVLLKADSEGRVGPSTYGRTHADAANVIARALKPHGGVLVYRGFVYNHHMDWRNLKNDRARAAYDHFAPLDGKFDDNVLVQAKLGPIDFQVREPVSPLFGTLQKTNVTIEFQVTQEYTGQQRHLCFLLPMWKQVLNFDFRTNNQATVLKNVVSGQRFHRPLGGMVAVTNVGLDQNWLGHDLAMANLYAFGRIAWNPDLPAEQVVDEWTRLTFGHNDQVVSTINNMQLRSWKVYEDYTGPLGAGGLTDIIGVHYGPGIESSERNGWGQWHRADHDGIGMDRTVSTGTGYAAQYPPEVAARYESLGNTPDQLLLFFHHVPYLHKLHSGKTVIQHIYDVHYQGASEAQAFPEQWEHLHGLIDDERYQAVLTRLRYQAGHAIVWRDAICNWFAKTSGIPDDLSRVGRHPNRIEAEASSLSGYVPIEVTPWEVASGGRAVACPRDECTAIFHVAGEAGVYDVNIEYFDQNNGDSRYDVYLGDQLIDRWTANWSLARGKPDGHSSTRRQVHALSLKPGDSIRIVGRPDRQERAALDYVEFTLLPDAVR